MYGIRKAFVFLLLVESLSFMKVNNWESKMFLVYLFAYTAMAPVGFTTSCCPTHTDKIFHTRFFCLFIH